MKDLEVLLTTKFLTKLMSSEKKDSVLTLMTHKVRCANLELRVTRISVSHCTYNVIYLFMNK